MKYKKSNSVDSDFTEEFLTKYMSLGFGNLPKKEIDILVFGLITKLGYLEGEDYYSIAKELMVEERKVKRLILDDSLRNERNSTLKKSIDSIKSAIFENKKIKPEFKDNIITISIENPIEKRDFLYAIRSLGYSYSANNNPDRIELPIYVFMTLFCRFYDDMYFTFKEVVKNKLKSDSEYEKAFKDSKPLIERINSGINSIAEPISGLTIIGKFLGI